MTINPVTPLQSKSGRPDAGQVLACVTPPQSSWRNPIAAAALALVLGFASQDAAALALGRVNVLSALGEPLRAEIDVPEITAEEAASLRAAIANPDAFRAAGLEYNPALGNAQISLQRRANGTAFLRVTSDRTINEPFVDMILEASWASGRIVRDYTMLFDPSNMRQAAAPSVTAPAAAAPAAAPSAPAVATRPSAPAAVAAAPRPARSESMPKPASKPVQAAPKDGITVKPGDTAAALAARYKPAGVSLDQMLVAMLNNSPDAFIGGNVNRLKSGAVIDMQAASAAAPGTGEGQARETIVAQSKDFNEFRRRLASGAPTAAAAAPSRAAGGKVQANVTEPKAAAAAPDKLTLSKGSVAAKAKEEAIAKEKQAKDNAARVAELSKNIQDLNKLGTTTAAKPSAAAPAGAPAAAASAPGVKVAGGAPSVPALPTPSAAPATPVAAAPAAAASAPKTTTTAVVSTPTTATSTVASAPATSTPTVAASTPTSTVTAAAPAASAPAPAVAAPKPQTPPPPPPPEPTFIESLMADPTTLYGAGGALLAGLGGLAFWRIRQKKKGAQVDSSFLESRLQPDSFFGASGGQRVDTADSGSAAGAGSSMVYSPSQLDAAGDVDPVAEADVYLAYGRDLQAEEILKEALRSNSSRVAIHAKLMEIYAKRRDTKAFESIAKEAFNLTQGAGPEWDAGSALGREIDPSNPLYQQGNAPAGAGLAGSVMLGGAAAAATAAYSATQTVPQQAQPQADADFDIDLDLDFSAGGDDLVSAPSAGMINTPVNEETTAGMRAQPVPEPMVDFDMSEPGALDGIKLSAPDMASLSNGLNFSSTPTVPSLPTAPMSLKTEPSGAGALEFDLGDLTLDLPGATAASNAVDAGVSGDPLETKLALAMEFKDIGDADGARSLVQEVADEASGALKARALKMLADLG
ncbi:FimV/HubP family polar landmark protein [Variovorax sp. PCZ-1]|uniref:FimV/HubP family polar landmark protein n=1 Tax=Variovorax sp. PCZ-1 TaxID=2835533 RepID=UPI001BCF92B2|nr:FimV/HubP family polar landmark protein [Variovorax sp. PCZ-1]MBS7808301.1 fimbrial protein FimV [Variovorax sp. PCZ-1]